MAKGRPLPEWYVNEPQIFPAEEFYLAAFYELNTCRNNGGPIPWRDIIDYAAHKGLDEEVTPAFVQIIRAMDIAFLGWLDDEQERKRKANSRTGSIGGKTRGPK